MNMLELILRGEHPEYGIKEVRFNTIDATMYFFITKKANEERDLLIRLSNLCERLNKSEIPGVGHWSMACGKTFSEILRMLPESYLEDGYTDFERELFDNYNADIECGRLIRDNGNFDEIVYKIKINKNKFILVDRNGYELIFD